MSSRLPLCPVGFHSPNSVNVQVLLAVAGNQIRPLRSSHSAAEPASISTLLVYPFVSRTSRFRPLRKRECNPPVPVHRPALARPVPAAGQPSVHLIPAAVIPPGLRQPLIHPQKSGLAAVSRLEISPAAPVLFFPHRRPNPGGLPLLPPSHPHVSPHLIQSQHPDPLPGPHPPQQQQQGQGLKGFF